jgi:hypothetical protein
MEQAPMTRPAAAPSPRRTAARALTCAAALALLSAATDAHAQPGSATLAGRVVDAASDAPIAAAEVSMVGGGRARARTAEDGTFRLTGLPAGVHLLTVRALGYERATTWLQVHADTEGSVVVRLEVRPVALADVRVEAPRTRDDATSFWRPRAGSTGRLLTRADIEARGVTRMTDLLREIPGAQIVPVGTRGHVVAFARARRAGPCPAAVYVDGIPFTLSPLGLDEIHPDEVEAIEVFSGPSQVPPQYGRHGSDMDGGMLSGGRGGRMTQPRGSSSCGVIAVWTRTAAVEESG